MKNAYWVLIALLSIALTAGAAHAFNHKLWKADDPRTANPLSIYNSNNPLNPTNKFRSDNDYNSINRFKSDNPLSPINRYNSENQLNPINQYSPDSPLNPINRYRSPNDPPKRGMFKSDW